MSCGGWSAMTVDDWNLRFQEEYQLAKDRQGTLQREESNRRFYKNLNEIRAYLGMSPGDYLCDSIGSGSATIIDHGEQDTESKTDSRPGQDSQISAMEGSNQGRIPNPRTGNAGAADLPTKNSQATSNDVFPKIEGAKDPTILWGINIDLERPTLFKKFGTELDGGASGQKLVVEPKEHLEVITYPLKIVVEVESDEIDGTQGVFTANRKNLFDVRMNLSEFLGISSAYKVFVEMPGLGMVERGTNVSSWIVELSLSIAAVIGKQKALDGNLVFDPGGGLDGPDHENDECRVAGVVSTDRVDCKPSIGALFSLQCIKDRLILMPFDRGRSTAIPIGLGGVGVDSYIGKRLIMVFDPGGDLGFLFVLPGDLGVCINSKKEQ